MESMRHISGVEDFENETDSADSCLFRLGQIGELARDRSLESVNNEFKDIDWSGYRGLRNRIDHGYDSVSFKYNIIFETLRDDIPILHKRLLEIKEILEKRQHNNEQ